MEDPVQKADEKQPVLAYEETPLIDPVPIEDPSSVIPEATQVFSDRPEVEVPRVAPQEAILLPKKSRKSHIGTIIFIGLLFGLGIWLSSQLRSFFAPAVSEEIAIPTLSLSNSLSSGTALTASPGGAPRKTMTIMSGATKKPIEGISYQLPSGVNAPVCDSASCASQGTNLPGGTRFTVAARGKGQLLPDFRGAILTDAAGREFTMKQTMIGTQYVYEYIGDFTGRTGGGYTFTKMRGVLVPISETFGIEFNHFASAGVTTDFAADDKIFDDIIKSLKGGVAVPVASPTASGL